MLVDISSTNNTLKEVYLKNNAKNDWAKYLGAYEQREVNDNPNVARAGDLYAQGNTRVHTLINDLSKTKAVLDQDRSKGNAGKGADQYIDGATAAQYNGYAFTDVRVIDGSAFAGNLKLNAILTEAVVGKYLDIKDQAPAFATTDNVEFTYNLGADNDVFDLAISSANLAAAGTATREDFVLNISGGDGKDMISTAIYQPKSYNSSDPDANYGQWDGNSTSDGTKLADNLSNAGLAAWYVNAGMNANLTINAGDGDDVVNTFGAGDWTIILGTGNDTYYADNTADKAVWVFNTTDQSTPGGVKPERQLDNLESSANSNYIDIANAHGGLYGLKLRVVFKDIHVSNLSGTDVFISKVVEVPAINKYKITDNGINQAIKAAINTDPVLGKLLTATDGPGNTLVVSALSDGKHAASDLSVEFAIPVRDALIAHFSSSTEIEAWKAAVGTTGTWSAIQIANTIISAFDTLAETSTASTLTDFASASAGTGYGGWYGAKADTDYQSALANDGSNVNSGSGSEYVSSNRIDSGAGDDVIVLSTGHFSHDTIVYTGFDNGFDTIVNFVDSTKTSGPVSTFAQFTVDLANANATGVIAATTIYSLSVGGGANLTSGTATTTGTNSEIQIAALFDGKSVTVGGITWNVSVAASSSILTFTQAVTTPTHTSPAIPPIGQLSVTNGGTVSSPSSFTPVVSNQGGLIGDPGTDYLDFSSYGATKAYLDNTAKLDADGNVIEQNKGLSNATDKSAFTSGNLTADARFIVMKQLYSNDSIYEITLWKNTATNTDANIDLTAADHDILEGTIGTVDFGKLLDTTTGTDWFETAGMVLL